MSYVEELDEAARDLRELRSRQAILGHHARLSRERAEKAEAERDEARAEVDRVTQALDRMRALADFWEGTCDPQFPPSNVMEALFAVDQIRLVLAGGIPGPGGVRFAAADAEDGGPS